MATITGGMYRNPNTSRNESARIVAPVVKQYEFATSSGADGYKCLGVVGNTPHLRANTPGDHTWFSKHTTFRTVGGPTLYPKRGFIYAGDWYVPEPEKFERWILARLRAGIYLDLIKYFNILNRHWNRKAIRAGKMFAYATYSGDHHLHTSWMPGAEHAVVDLFGDYEHFRTTGKNRPVPGVARPAESKPAAPKPKLVDAVAAKLPTVRKGSSGAQVKVVQACLVARSFWPCNDRSARTQIDGKFGADTEAKVKAFQKSAGLPETGVVDGRTWAALTPDYPETVMRGKAGFYAWLMQCLLLARGFNPGVIDGDAGDQTVAALKKFQAVRKVKNSVVKGRGDGIGGTNTWISLVTF